MRARILGFGDKRSDEDECFDPVRLPFGARLDRGVFDSVEGFSGIFFLTTTRSTLTV